jgi:hypothetical protein
VNFFSLAREKLVHVDDRCADHKEYASEMYASDMYDEAIDVADEAEPVNETEPVREQSRSPEYDVANSTVHELRCADSGAGNDQALVRMRDTEFGCGSRCHIRVRAVLTTVPSKSW